VWHLPLFYIQGTYQSALGFMPFAITTIGLAFALAALRRISGSVWLCMFFHCMCNAASSVLSIEQSYALTFVGAGVMILASLLLVYLHDRKKASG
jgi:hypothetical protein